MRIIAIFVEMSANSEMNKINEETPITSFTLNDLLSMSGSRSRLGLMSSYLAANSASVMQTFRYPCRIDAFIIGVGTEGEATVSFNLREYKLQKDTLFVSTPKNIVQVHSSGHFRCHIVHVSPGLLEQISVDTKRMMPLFLKIAMHPCLGLTPEEARTVREFISLIERVTDGPETPFGMEVVGGLIGATIYKVGDILAHYLAEHPEVENPVHSRAEEYFRQFMQLLGEHYKEERSVGFYARKLCITPKYLTTLIKQISGKSVSEWIDSYVILEAKTLLKYSNMSVQEISYYLNFPNQSFFGSYFKRNTGMSPSQYKTMI